MQQNCNTKNGETATNANDVLKNAHNRGARRRIR